jgi:hypothetical protein
MKIKMFIQCSCGYIDNDIDIDNIDGECPNCHISGNNVYYGCAMNPKDFLETLGEMSENEICKYANEISICAKDLAEQSF